LVKRTRGNSIFQIGIIFLILCVAPLIVNIKAANATLLHKAQEEPVVYLVAQPAFDGAFKFGEWLPILVELENNGSDLETDVQIRVTGGGGTMVFSVPVELPSGSHKIVTVYALPNNFSRKLEVQLVSNNDLLVSESISVVPLPPINYLVGLIAPKRGAISLINGVEFPGQDRPITLIDLEINELPARFEGLRSFDLLIFNDVDTSNLSPEQIDALHTWVHQGGRIIIGGGINAKETLFGFPHSIINIELEGTTQLNSLSSLIEFSGSESAILNPGPFTISNVQIEQSQHLVNEGNFPIVIESPIGSGSLIFIALDPSGPPFNGWGGTVSFWEKLISAGGAYPDWMPVDVSTKQQISEQMNYALSNLPMLDLPSIKGLALLLGLYILMVGPVNYLVLRRQNKLHWAWFSIPSITVIFSIAAFGLGYVLHGTDIFLNRISIINLQNSGTAHTTSYMGLFSPDQRSYKLEVFDDVLVSPLESFINPWDSSGVANPSFSGEIQITQGNPAIVKGLNIEQWSMQSFMTEGMSKNFRQLIVDMQLEPDSLNGTIKNDSPFLIKDAIVLQGKRFLRLGDIAPGDEVEVIMDLSRMTNPNFLAPISYLIFEDQFNQVDKNGSHRHFEVKRTIIESVLERSSIQHLTSSRAEQSPLNYLSYSPLLIGWLDEAPPQVRVEGIEPSQETTALLIYTIDYQLPNTNQVGLPVGFIPGELISTPEEGGICGEPGSSAVYLNRGEGIFEFSLPSDVHEIYVDTLKLSFWSDNESSKLPKLSIFDQHSGEWIILDGLSQGVNIVPEAERFIKDSRIIQVKIVSDKNTQGCFYVLLGMEGHRP